MKMQYILRVNVLCIVKSSLRSQLIHFIKINMLRNKHTYIMINASYEGICGIHQFTLHSCMSTSFCFPFLYEYINLLSILV